MSQPIVRESRGSVRAPGRTSGVAIMSPSPLTSIVHDFTRALRVERRRLGMMRWHGLVCRRPDLNQFGYCGSALD